jgi:hypothetical protein
MMKKNEEKSIKNVKNIISDRILRRRRIHFMQKFERLRGCTG